jgi:hypothetical protein
MAFALVQAGTTLYMIDDVGGIEALTLPAGVELSSERTPRFAIMNRQVIMVNSPNKSLIIDGLGTVRPLQTFAPLTGPTLAAGAGTGITGSVKARVAFATLAGDGSILTMSPFGPESNVVTVSNQDIAVSLLAVSTDPNVNARVIVRNVVGGEDFFEALIVMDNISTTATLSLTDAQLPILPTDLDVDLPPGSDGTDQMVLITEWKGVLWGRGSRDVEIDDLLLSFDGEFWKWRLEDALLADPRGGDEFGITAILKRRDEMGIGRRGRLLKVIGDDLDNFEVKEVLAGVGPAGHEGCQVIRDVGYFLSMEDGAWSWGPTGVQCISDNDVHPWFTTDEFFNRARFPFAKSRINPKGPKWEICLAAAGSTIEDRWISYDIVQKKWLGPHRSSAFTSIGAAGTVYDDDVLRFCMFGNNDGFLRRTEDALKLDDAAAIDFDVIGKFHGDGVSAKRNWLQPTVTVRPQASGTMSLIPVVGEVPAVGVSPTEQAAILIALTRGQHIRLRYGGTGRFYRPRWRCTESNVRAQLLGYELPYIDIGDRGASS